MTPEEEYEYGYYSRIIKIMLYMGIIPGIVAIIAAVICLISGA